MLLYEYYKKLYYLNHLIDIDFFRIRNFFIPLILFIEINMISPVSYFFSSNAKRTIQTDNSFISYIIDPSYAIIREYLMIALNRSPSISISKFPPVAST